MGLQVFTPDGQTIDVLRADKLNGNSVWLWCNVQSLQHNLVSGKRPVPKRKAGESTPHFLVEFSPAAFRTIVAADKNALHDFQKQSRKRKSFALSQEHLTMDAAMQQCISSIIHYKGSENTKTMFVYARISELLWLQQENYLRSQEPRAVYIKTEYDKERIVFARDYLLTHLDAPPSLGELASIAGINEFKLKRGFREMFDQSVFAYLADVRLEMASRALREKQKSITRIAFELGYASLQHFSAAFKKKYGVAPGRYG